MMRINDRDFERLVSFVRENYGINLINKRQLIDARLAFAIKKRGFSDFSSYIKEVLANPDGEECRRMINKLSTNYTFFFREPEYIDKLSEIVLKTFLSKGKNKIKILCAACSSGQEPYSVAMAIEMHKKHLNLSFDYEITGIDINTEMLEIARNGKYAIEELSSIPQNYRSFTVAHTRDTFEIAQVLRDKIHWEYTNILSDTFSKTCYDIIFCRNVMIYFTSELRQSMTGRLYNALSSGGYLFTGATESIDLERKYFQYLAPTFYHKK